jgi:hypothetical protein
VTGKDAYLPKRGKVMDDRLRPPAAMQQLGAGGDAQSKEGSAVSRGALMLWVIFLCFSYYGVIGRK